MGQRLAWCCKYEISKYDDLYLTGSQFLIDFNGQKSSSCGQSLGGVPYNFCQNYASRIPARIAARLARVGQTFPAEMIMNCSWTFMNNSWTFIDKITWTSMKVHDVVHERSWMCMNNKWPPWKSMNVHECTVHKCSWSSPWTLFMNVHEQWNWSVHERSWMSMNSIWSVHECSWWFMINKISLFINVHECPWTTNGLSMKIHECSWSTKKNPWTEGSEFNIIVRVYLYIYHCHWYMHLWQQVILLIVTTQRNEGYIISWDAL